MALEQTKNPTAKQSAYMLLGNQINRLGKHW